MDEPDLSAFLTDREAPKSDALLWYLVIGTCGLLALCVIITDTRVARLRAEFDHFEAEYQRREIKLARLLTNLTDTADQAEGDGPGAGTAPDA